MSTQNHLPYWLAALYLPNVGPRTVLRWLQVFTDIKSLFAASDDELDAKGIAIPHRNALRAPDWKRVEADLAWANASENAIISLDDVTYPPLLKEIYYPPLVLFVRGNQEALLATQLAMVGARNATVTGLKNAEYFAYALAKAGYVITSGLALGVDGASHKGALAAGGLTIGVCGTGLNHIYPLSHRPLARNMLEQNGAIISEFPLATPPKAENFPRRNRVIGGMSKGVLVVEAALKSGSLITARHALEQGREVFAIPGSIHNPLAKGCHYLLREGAKLVETITDILEEFGDENVPVIKPVPKDYTGLKPKERRLLEQIEYEITAMDAILLASGLTAGEVSSMLLTLELNGYIQSISGGYIRI